MPPPFSLQSYVFGALLLIIDATLPLFADDQLTIRWLHPDFPPVYILEGERAGEGVGDRVLSYFERRLPGYRHQRGVANFKRIIATLAAGKHACGITLLKNEARARVVAYSEPFMIAPQTEIVTTRRHLPTLEPLLDEEGGLSLGELLTAVDLTLGYSLGRSYAGAADRIIATHADASNSLATSGSDIFEGLMRMLKHRRIDYTIGYGYEARYIARRLGFESELVVIPLREQPGFARVYAGCPKDAWGRRVIAEVNTVARQARRDPEVYGAYRDWLDADGWRRYEQALAELLWAGDTTRE